MRNKITILGFLLLTFCLPAVSQHSVLSSGKWYKVGVSETGVQRLTYSDLSSLGLDVDHVNPKNIRIFHNGGGLLNEFNDEPRFDDLQEIPIWVAGESDGKFDPNDYILFYARGPVTWYYNTGEGAFLHRPNAYDDYSYAFLTVGSAPGKRMEKSSSPTASSAVSVRQFLDYQLYEKDVFNIINAGRTYYGDVLDGNNLLNLNFTFPNAWTQRPCYVKTNLAGRNFTPARFELYANDKLLQSMQISVTASGSDHTFSYPASGSGQTTVTGDNVKVTLKHIGISGTTSIGYVDYILVNAWRSLKMVGKEMLFRNPDANDPDKVYQYDVNGASSDLQVWDVTDSICPRIVNGQLTGTVYSFKVHGNLRNEFVAFNGQSYHAPALLGEVENQDLRSDRGYDYLMVVYPDFLEQAERLKALHAVYDPDLRIKIVTPQQIYNEFSCGAQDVSAIRDYCRMLYQDSRPLRYLLLFGDASFDFKNRSETVCFVPTYEPVSSTDIQSSIATDDFFCFMDAHEGPETSNSKPDIAAGRLPVSTVEQATQMVDKIKNYLVKDEVTMQPWRNVITFMSDDAQRNEFFDHSEYYAAQIKQTGGDRLVIDKLYLDAYEQENTPNGQLAPELNKALNNRMEKGTLILNYVGHGGEVQLADERIMQRADVNSWRNGPHYPLMITGTCEFSRYDDHTRTSLGEYSFLNRYGGMVAMFTTARVTYGYDNKLFISAVYDHLFDIVDGERMRFGDVYRMARQRGIINERRYVMFGDPALRLPMPKWTVETTKLEDTIRALQPTTIEGVVKDLNGNVVNTFNGLLHVSVFDKETTYTTFGDEDVQPRTFQLRNSVIFNGKTEVVNGHFSIDFIVPRDISYRYGNGMVSFYATDFVNDASGLEEDFVIGGFYDDAMMDNDPPLVQLFIDDERFVSGGITGSNPTLIAYVEDASGINTTGTGIGHDIVASLEGPSSTSYILNDYFEADLGSQGKGKISYRMPNLSDGEYVLTLKVWDIYNNSGVAQIKFNVNGSDRMVLENPSCAPNPFNDQTYFSFGHNQIGNDMEVQICVYDVMGRRVAILHETVAGTSARTNPIPWDGCSSGGSKLPAGVYVYCITATNDQQESASVTSKLIITR